MASDIEAGRAHVTIGVKTDGLAVGLRNATEQLKSFGLNSAGIGTLMSGLSIGPAIKSFADYGETIGKLTSKTGMGVEMIGGLQYAAEASGISAGAVSATIKSMQRNVGGSSKEVSQALQSIGLSVKELRGMSSEDQFLKIVDGLAAIPDPGERAAKGMQLLGKSYFELLPILENGSAEIQRAAREVKQLHGVLGSEGTENAKKLDDAFDRLTKGTKGLALEIGNALYPVVKPVVDKLIDLTVAAADFVEQNPELIQAFVKDAASVAGIGIALAGATAAFELLTSPVFLVIGGIMMIGAACLAVTDTLGVTKTGFGDLFNSIRIDGVGLATHMTNVWDTCGVGFDVFKVTMKVGWEVIKGGFYAMVDGLKSGWYGMIELLFKGMSSLVTNSVAGFNKIISVWNNVAAVAGGPIIGKIDASKATGIIDGAGQLARDQKDKYAALAKRDMMDAGTASKAEWDGLKQRSTDALNKLNQRTKADNDGTTGFHIDTEKLKSAFVGISDNLFNAIFGPLKGFIAGVKHQTFEEPGAKPTGPATDPVTGKPSFGAIGTFNSFAGSGIAAAGVFDMQLKESKKTNELLGTIAGNTSAGGGGGTFAG